MAGDGFCDFVAVTVDLVAGGFAEGFLHARVVEGGVDGGAHVIGQFGRIDEVFLGLAADDLRDFPLVARDEPLLPVPERQPGQQMTIRPAVRLEEHLDGKTIREIADRPRDKDGHGRLVDPDRRLVAVVAEERLAEHRDDCRDADREEHNLQKGEDALVQWRAAVAQHAGKSLEIVHGDIIPQFGSEKPRIHCQRVFAHFFGVYDLTFAHFLGVYD